MPQPVKNSNKKGGKVVNGSKPDKVNRKESIDLNLKTQLTRLLFELDLGSSQERPKSDARDKPSFRKTRSTTRSAQESQAERPKVHPCS
jgi:hypothetical protein